MNTQTHISYEVSKKLNEFLGKSAPEPVLKYIYYQDGTGPHFGKIEYKAESWVYQLHDLLSKPFCEAFMKSRHGGSTAYYGEKILWAHFYGGMPAVESALLEMMEESK